MSGLDWLVAISVFVGVLAIVMLKHLHHWSAWRAVAYTSDGDVIQERKCRKASCGLIERRMAMK